MEIYCARCKLSIGSLAACLRISKEKMKYNALAVYIEVKLSKLQKIPLESNMPNFAVVDV